MQTIKCFGLGMVMAVICCLTMTSCSKELTQKDALAQITAQKEFQEPYYAPMRVGEMVLTGNNFKKTDEYIRKNYGELIDAGLVTVKVTDRNSWRAVINIELTDKGEAMSDKRRGDQKRAFVTVCRMVPVQVNEFKVLSEGNIMECVYTFQEQEITPFGNFCGFQEGKEYKDTRTFVRARGSWRLK